MANSATPDTEDTMDDIFDTPMSRLEAAKYAGVSDRTISRWMRSGALHFSRDHLTGRPIFTRAAVDAARLRVHGPQKVRTGAGG